MKKLLAVVVITLMVTLILSSSVYSYLIIDSQRTYPTYVTIDDEYTVCVQIKEDNLCQENTNDITYGYTYYSQEGDLYPLQEYFEKYHFNADELEETHVWCGNAIGEGEPVIYTQFYCLDNLNKPCQDFHSSSVSYGYAYVNLTSKFKDDIHFGKHVGESLAIEAFLEDPRDVEMYYTVYNVTQGIIPFILEKEMQKIEGQYMANFTIPSNAPFGFIELKADSYYKRGGKFISYAAIPYNSEISVDGETTMGSTIDLTFGIAIEYGKINGVSTEIILPNWTVQKIYLDHVNTSASYTIPMLPGNYTVESTVDHTTLDGRKIIKNFYVNPYELDIDSGIKVYEQGDTVTIKIGVVDSNDTAVNLTDIELGVGPEGFLASFDEDDMIPENKYYKLIYPTDENASTGKYVVKVVEAIDGYGLRYSGNETFTVNKKDRTIQFTIYPSTLYKKIESMNETEDAFRITNTGTDVMTGITISKGSGESSKYITINKVNSTTTLEPGNSTSFRVIIQPEDDMENKLYYGNISVSSKGITQKIPVTLDVSLTAEMTILNKTIVTEALKNKEHKIYITIENAGGRILTGITASLTGGLKEYEGEITPPENIIPGSRRSIVIAIKPIQNEDSYSGEVEISADNASGKVDLTLTVVEDCGDDIDKVENNRIAMRGRLDDLISAGAIETDSIEQDLADLQADISEMRSEYLNGEYVEAKSMLAGVQNKANIIDEALEGLESSEAEKCGNGICDYSEDHVSCPEDCDSNGETCNYDDFCDDDEGCDCEDCEDDEECSGSGGGGSPVLIIVVIIVVVIIVAVVATSVVPDDDGQNYGKR